MLAVPDVDERVQAATEATLQHIFVPVLDIITRSIEADVPISAIASMLEITGASSGDDAVTNDDGEQQAESTQVGALASIDTTEFLDASG